MARGILIIALARLQSDKFNTMVIQISHAGLRPPTPRNKNFENGSSQERCAAASLFIFEDAIEALVGSL